MAAVGTRQYYRAVYTLAYSARLAGFLMLFGRHHQAFERLHQLCRFSESRPRFPKALLRKLTVVRPSLPVRCWRLCGFHLRNMLFGWGGTAVRLRRLVATLAGSGGSTSLALHSHQGGVTSRRRTTYRLLQSRQIGSYNRSGFRK